MPSLLQFGPERREPGCGRHRIARVAFVALAVLLAWAALGVVGPPSGAQGSGERIESFDAQLTVNPSGTVSVVETIRYNFGFNARHGIIREIPTRFVYEPDDRYDRVTPIALGSVSTPGSDAPGEYTVETTDGVMAVKIGDPDRTITGVHTYEIRYTIEGALNSFADHDELYWNITGNGWTVPIDSTTAEVRTPAPTTQVGCFAGAGGSRLWCDSADADGDVARFAQSELTAGEGLTVVVGFEPGVVATTEPILEERWSITRAFSVTPTTVGLASLLLVVVLFLVGRLLWSVGRDRRLRGDAVATAFATDADVELVGDERVTLGRGEPIPVEFVPPDGLRPGLIGTLIDEVAHPLDVTATIIDLAVRGYLRIEETKRSGLFRRADWRLTRFPDPPNPDELQPYEQSLLSGLFKDGDEVELSDLKKKFAERMQKVRTELYSETVDRGWFARRPDRTRLLWLFAGISLALLGTALVVLAAVYTSWGLVPIPIVIGGLVLLVGSRWAPSRTARGTGVLRRALGFRRFIEESEARRAEFAEKKNLFTEYLPYAVVFGATEKWAKAFEGLNAAEAVDSWYSSSGAFEASAFVGAVESFSTSAAGTLSASASSGSSGFSGGGGSGGGFGGGGGGSW